MARWDSDDELLDRLNERLEWDSDERECCETEADWPMEEAEMNPEEEDYRASLKWLFTKESEKGEVQRGQKTPLERK